ncbi:MAG: hypothetical protein FJX77_04035 [Armatimonadetes bacterium]|nr:hypothetical protein [Armatimonadota bacterium]
MSLGARLWGLWENPVLGREFRSRFRGGRSFLVTGGYTLVVAAAFLIAYWSAAYSITTGPSTGPAAARLGQMLWTVGVVTQAILLPLSAPAFTCGGISLEREREMLELLLLTRLSALQIAIGKLSAGSGQALILMLCSGPVLSLCFLLGGVSPGEMLQCAAVLAASILTAGALGLFASALTLKTRTATALSYAVIAYELIGTMLLASITGYRDDALSPAFAVVLPGSLLVAAVVFILVDWPGVPHVGPWITAAVMLLVVSLFATLILQAQMRPGNGPPDWMGWMSAIHPVACMPFIARTSSMKGSEHWWAICTAYHLVGATVLFVLSVIRIHRLRTS